MHSDLHTLLEQVPLFAGFGDDALHRLASRSLLRTYAAGHLLFSTGEPCRGLYVVESGRVRIYRTSPAGREQVLHVEGPGRAVAELPLFDGGAYPASAVTEVVRSDGHGGTISRSVTNSSRISRAEFQEARAAREEGKAGQAEVLISEARAKISELSVPAGK